MVHFFSLESPSHPMWETRSELFLFLRRLVIIIVEKVLSLPIFSSIKDSLNIIFVFPVSPNMGLERESNKDRDGPDVKDISQDSSLAQLTITHKKKRKKDKKKVKDISWDRLLSQLTSSTQILKDLMSQKSLFVSQWQQCHKGRFRVLSCQASYMNMTNNTNTKKYRNTNQR